MHGKSSKFTSAALSALLLTQGLLCFAGVTLVALKDRTPVAVAVSQDAQLR